MYDPIVCEAAARLDEASTAVLRLACEGELDYDRAREILRILRAVDQALPTWDVEVMI